MAPAVLGAKPPLLMVFGCLAGIPAAIGAGLFADALGGLPFGGSAFVFAVAAVFVRMMPRGAFLILMPTAALYQTGLVLWSRGNMDAQSVTGALLATAILEPVLAHAIRLGRRRIGLDRKEAKT